MSKPVGKRAQVAAGSVPGALLHRSRVARRADDVSHQALGRRVPRFGALRCRLRVVDRPRRRQRDVRGVLVALARRAAEPHPHVARRHDLGWQAGCYRLVHAIAPELRAAVLLATFCGLRLGEIRGLRVRHLDLLHCTVRIEEQYQELSDGTLVLGPPKTDAGVLTIVIPQVIIPDLEQHFASVPLGADGLLFTTTSGAPMRRATLYTAWGRATKAVGITGLRFHDLRHTGNTLAVATGASTKELMARMGQSSPRAALIYQHATQHRDAAIAAGLSSMVEEHRSVTS